MSQGDPHDDLADLRVSSTLVLVRNQILHVVDEAGRTLEIVSDHHWDKCEEATDEVPACQAPTS